MIITSKGTSKYTESLTPYATPITLKYSLQPARPYE